MTAKALYALLCTYANSEGLAWPKAETLAEDLGVSKRTVVNALKELREQEFIELVNYRHDASGYRIAAVYRVNSPKSSPLPKGSQLPKGSALRKGPQKKPPKRSLTTRLSEASCAAEQTMNTHT